MNHALVCWYCWKDNRWTFQDSSHNSLSQSSGLVMCLSWCGDSLSFKNHLLSWCPVLESSFMKSRCEKRRTQYQVEKQKQTHLNCNMRSMTLDQIKQLSIFYLSCSWVRWHRTNLEWQVLRRKEDWIQFLPADRGIEPGIAGWKAQMLPLCYAVPPKNCHWKFYLEEFLKDHRHLSLEVLYIKFEFDVLFLPLLYPLVKMYVKT